MTCFHFFCQWIFSSLLTTYFPNLGGDQVSAMSWSTFLRISIPCGLVTSLDVGFSNMALARITLSFYTMVKASSPIFTVAFAFALGIERFSFTLIWIVLIIVAGELLSALGEGVEFDRIGFFLILTASALSGLRWTIVQKILSNVHPPLRTTFALMRIVSPSMFVSMLLFVVSYEKPWGAYDYATNSTMTGTRLLEDTINTDEGEVKSGPYFYNSHVFFSFIGLAGFGAILAITMIVFEFYLIMKSSAIVLMIGGVLKEIITIVIGWVKVTLLLFMAMMV